MDGEPGAILHGMPAWRTHIRGELNDAGVGFVEMVSWDSVKKAATDTSVEYRQANECTLNHRRRLPCYSRGHIYIRISILKPHAGIICGVGDVVAQQGVEGRGIRGHNWGRTLRFSSVGFVFVVCYIMEVKIYQKGHVMWSTLVH